MVVAAIYDIIEDGAFTDFREVRVVESIVGYRNKQVILGGVKTDGTILVYSKQNDTEIAARIAIEGGSGVYGAIFRDSSILTDADAEIVADNLLKKFGTIPIEVAYESYTTGWKAGTKQAIALPTFGISGGDNGVPERLLQIPSGYSFWAAQSKIVDNAIYTYSLLSFNDGGFRLEIFFSKHDLQGNQLVPLTRLTNYAYPLRVTGANFTVHNNKLYWVYRTGNNNQEGTANNVLYFATSELDGSNFQSQNIANIERGYEPFIEVVNGGAYLAWDEIISGASQPGKVARINLDGTGYYQYAATWSGGTGFYGIVDVSNTPCVVIMNNNWRDLRYVLLNATTAPNTLIYSSAATMYGNTCSIAVDGKVYTSFIEDTNPEKTSVVGASPDGSGFQIAQIISSEQDYYIGSYIQMALNGRDLVIVSPAYVPEDNWDREHSLYISLNIDTFQFGDWKYFLIPNQENGALGGHPGIVPGVINGVLTFVWQQWSDGYTYENFYFTTIQKEYFLIEEVNIEDLGAGNLVSGIIATKRSGTDFSTQRTPDATDYFSDLVRLAKNSMTQAQTAHIAIEETAFTVQADENASIITLDTNNQTVLEKTFALGQQRTLVVDVAAKMVCSESLLLTVEIYLDDVQTGFIGEDYFLVDAEASSAKRTYSVGAFLKDVPAAASVNVKVKMKTSNGTATIAAGMANLIVSARGVKV